MSDLSGGVNVSAFIEDYNGYPLVTNGSRLLSTENGIAALAICLVPFDEFDARLVLEALNHSDINTFLVQPNRFISNQVPDQEKQRPWERVKELVEISRMPVLAKLGGGVLLITSETTIEEAVEKGQEFRRRIDELKLYREVNIDEALSSESLQSKLARDYRITVAGLQKIKSAISGNTFVATRLSANDDKCIEHLIDSQSRLNLPTVMIINSQIIIAQSDDTAQDLRGRLNGLVAMVGEYAELREQQTFNEFLELDLFDPDAIISWLITVADRRVSFQGDCAETITNKLADLGYLGHIPDNLWELYFSENGHELKTMLAGFSEDGFQRFLINVAVSEIEDDSIGFVPRLIEIRNSTSSK